MKILVACEESQAVTTRLRAEGHEAYSCDIIPTSGDHPEWHIQDDVLYHLDTGWDMMIAFPPCTHLASSGARHFAAKRASGVQQEATAFFMALVNAPIMRIAIENPIGIMSTVYRKPDQIIQPYQFGDPFQKSTCLWLQNLPLLEATEVVDKGEMVEFGSGKRMPKWYADAARLPTKERAALRSKTFPGIADAMVQQWGNLYG